MGEITQSFWAKRSLNPKTVLGFYATVLGIGLAACTSLTTVLAITRAADWLIPWVIAFGGGFLVLLVTGVFIINVIDTTKLMLSPVSGTEYAAIHKGIVLGDSLTGERVLETTERAELTIEPIEEAIVVAEEEDHA